MLVSVIIPTYGRVEYLQRTLHLLMQQEKEGFGYEIIVVDDGSPEPIAPLLEQYTKESPVPLRCIRKQNGGPASARNFGANEAKGELLLFVDDDVLVEKNFIQAHVETHQLFSPSAVNCDADRQIKSYPEPFRCWYEKQTSGWYESRHATLLPLSEAIYEFPSPAALTSANLSIHKEDFESVGGFETSYLFGCEDQDFGLRVSFRGLRAILSCKSKAIYVEPHNTLHLVCKRQYRGVRDTVLFTRRFVELCGEADVDKANSPIKWRTDSKALILKKSLRWLVGTRPVTPLMFGSISLLERIAPNANLLQSLYYLAVGASMQKGWREGLKLYGSEKPLDLQLLTTSK